MPYPPEPHLDPLLKLLRRQPVADMATLLRALGAQDRTTVFRHLKRLGYVSSFTHGGRHYALAETPRFDQDGLWFVQGIGFSAAGSLMDTVAKLVAESGAGMTASALRLKTQVQVHNTLRKLTRAGRVRKEGAAGRYLYLSPDAKRATQQRKARRELEASMQPSVKDPPLGVVVEILAEVIRSSPSHATSDEIAARLCARGLTIPVEVVDQTIARHAQKKTDS